MDDVSDAVNRELIGVSLRIAGLVPAKERFAMRKAAKVFGAAGILLLVIGIIIAAGIFCSASKERTIGIIGGADGPTLIFLGSQLKWIIILGSAVFISAAGCFIVSAVIRKKNKGGKNGT